MNKQAKSSGKRGIEWTDYTWNPVGGCKHSCRWTMPDGSIAKCYAESIAEGLAQSAYPNGFEHHYWRPDILEEPLNVRQPSRIFLDSMSDLMGHWVETEQILQVLEICSKAHWHTFQLLTKNAPRLLEFDFPSNVWVGVSVPPSMMFGKQLSRQQQSRMLTRMLDVLDRINVSVRWLSIEPLSFDISQLIRDSNLQWAVIGAATNGPATYQPKKEWVHNVLSVLDSQGTKVFFKGNLEWEPWREEFPDAYISTRSQVA